MLKALPRFCLLLFLCFLLVCAPEIFSAVSLSYSPSVPARQLLRIALCVQDPAASDAFYDALTIYMKERPTVHIRVSCVSESDLFSLSAPAPDLLVFADPIPYYPEDFVLPDSTASLPRLPLSDNAVPLLCGVLRTSTNQACALDLASHLLSFFQYNELGRR